MRCLTNEQKIMIVLCVFGFAISIGMLVLLTRYTSYNPVSQVLFPTGEIAVIRVYGVITYTGGPSIFGSSVSAYRLIDTLNRLNNDPNVKAIILDIDSPGGGAVASELIAERIHSLNKPVIAVCETMCASGAYLIASACKKIYVQNDTLTASIGVIIPHFNLTGYLRNKSIIYSPFKVGKYKDIGSEYRPTTSRERQYIQSMINQTYRNFVDMVEEYRHINFSKLPYMVKESAPTTGEEAVKLHLADQVAPLWVVEQRVNKEYCNGNCKIVYINIQESLLPF